MTMLRPYDPAALDDRGPIGLGVLWELDPYALRRQLSARGASPASLAAALGLPTSTVTRWLALDRAAAARLSTLHRVVDALNGSTVTAGHLVVTSWPQQARPVVVADLVCGPWSSR